MVMDSQIDLITLASGHLPRHEGHPRGCGCLSCPGHAPFCANDRRILPQEILSANRPKLEGEEALDGHGFANGPDNTCLWTSSKE